VTAALPHVRLKTAAVGLRPWIYRKMVARAPDVEDGSLVAIEARDGSHLGHGFYSRRSQIGLRVIQRGAIAEPVDEAFLRRRIRDAIYVRRKSLRLDDVTDAYRVVNSEGDDLSGLIVDRYADVASVEIHAYAWYRRLDLIEEALREELPIRRVVVSVAEKVERAEGFEAEARPGDAGANTRFHERGLPFRFEWDSAHKTGAFLDQRDNREALARYVADRDVFDGCCYQGAFALTAAVRGKAGRVVAVDLDEAAIALARENAKLCGAQRVEFQHADVFDALREVVASRRRFDVVVLDPPKLAASTFELARATTKYVDLNELGMKALRNHGLLLTCSCSGLVSEEMFLGLLRKAAARAGRKVRLHTVAGAAPDHPVSPHFPEGRYLKAVFATVEDS